MGIGDFFGTIVVATATANALSGRLKPKFGAKAIIALILMILFFIGMIVALVYGIIIGDFKLIFPGIIGSFAFAYILLISPYTQSSRNYFIEFPDRKKLDGFKLSYKGKPVNVRYRIDDKGKFAWAENLNKLGCLSYADGSKMSNFTKYKVMNYFTRWLHDNDLLSDEVRVSFEK